MAALSANNLRKTYSDTEVVAGLSFAVEPGTCFGLLGPNGAGKTTTLRLCLGLTAPDSGDIRLNGHVIPADAQQARGRIGVVPQFDNLDPDFTCAENLLVFGRYFGLKDADIRAKIPQLLDFAGLASKADARLSTLSGGMKRRLTLARAMVNDPDIIFLDEPTTGLDPQARHLIWERLKQLKSAGKTLILTTHFMDEAEQLCDRLVVMDKGKIMAEGSPADLIKRYASKEVLEVRFGSSKNLEIADQISHLGHRTEVLPDRILIYSENGEADLQEILKLGLEPVTSLVRRSSLEDVFLRLTGRTLVE